MNENQAQQNASGANGKSEILKFRNFLLSPKVVIPSGIHTSSDVA